MQDPTSKKIDPIRDRYFDPIQTAATVLTVLFYLSSILSIVVLLVDKITNIRLYELVQLTFLVATVATFVVAMATRLYLAPRARDASLADFLSSAFSVHLTYERTNQYYNNEEDDPFRKIGAQVLENSYFTRELVRSMCRHERIVAGLWLVAWLIALANRSSSVDLVVACSLVLFSEELLSRILRMEWFRSRVEHVHSSLFRRFQADGVRRAVFAAAVVEALVLYENAKASSGITVSSRLFDQRNAALSAEWDRIRKRLQ